MASLSELITTLALLFSGARLPKSSYGPHGQNCRQPWPNVVMSKLFACIDDPLHDEGRGWLPAVRLSSKSAEVQVHPLLEEKHAESRSASSPPAIVPQESVASSNIGADVTARAAPSPSSVVPPASVIDLSHDQPTSPVSPRSIHESMRGHVQITAPELRRASPAPSALSEALIERGRRRVSPRLRAPGRRKLSACSQPRLVCRPPLPRGGATRERERGKGKRQSTPMGSTPLASTPEKKDGPERKDGGMID